MISKKIILVFLGLFLVSSVLALPIYVKPLDGSGNVQPSTAFNYTFNFTTGADCSGVVLSNSSTITTGTDGVGFIDINVSEASSIPSYLCEYKNGTLRANHSLSSQLFGDVYVSGNVGIGTAEPGAKLEVNVGAVNSGINVFGSAIPQFQIGADTPHSLQFYWYQNAGYFGTNSNTYPMYFSGSNIYFTPNNVQTMAILNTGKVGIGTTTPSAKLEIAKGNGVHELNVSGLLYVNSTSGNVGIGTGSPGTKLEVSGTIKGTIIRSSSYQDIDGNSLLQRASGTHLKGVATENIYMDTDSDTDFYVGSSGQLFVNGSTGNVGIGTTAPGGTLDVSSGQVSIKIGAENNLFTRTDATSKYGRIGAAHYTNAEEPVALFLTSALALENRLDIGGGSSSMNAATLLRFYTAANSTTVTGTERMRIDSTGNVGIGTTGPGYKLEIVSDTGLKVTPISWGSVANPGSQFNSHALITPRGFSFSTDTITLSSAYQPTLGIGLAMSRPAPALAIRNNGGPSLLIESGNVGIGTTNPNAKLEINGTGVLLNVKSDSQSFLFINETNGEIKIGI